MLTLIVGAYLAIAGVLYAGHKDGIIKDETTVQTYRFELRAAEKSGDTIKADYLRARLESWGVSE